MYWNRKIGSLQGWTVPKVSIILEIASAELVGSTDSSLQWPMLLIFYIVFFLKLHCKDNWDFGTFTCIFFFNFWWYHWIPRWKLIKYSEENKSLNKTYTTYTFNDKIILTFFKAFPKFIEKFSENLLKVAIQYLKFLTFVSGVSQNFLKLSWKSFLIFLKFPINFSANSFK